MIELTKGSKIEEVKTIVKKTKMFNCLQRPQSVMSKTYKLKSGFVKKSLFITLGYVKVDDKCYPIEIFINSKDLSKAAEYIILTRLISAIFRRTDNPEFILEELRGIYDPGGGIYKKGKYYYSFYAEIADIIEQFYNEIGIIQPKQALKGDKKVEVTESNEDFKICPECGAKALKMENGCDFCNECGYSKCDK